jgi:hypothetical protein
MTRTSAKARIYTVVDVLAGVAVGAYSFRRLEDARTCMARLRAGRDLQEDDVQMFEGVLDAYPDESQVAEIGVR